MSSGAKGESWSSKGGYNESTLMNVSIPPLFSRISFALYSCQSDMNSYGQWRGIESHPTAVVGVERQQTGGRSGYPELGRKRRGGRPCCHQLSIGTYLSPSSRFMTVWIIFIVDNQPSFSLLLSYPAIRFTRHTDGSFGRLHRQLVRGLLEERICPLQPQKEEPRRVSHGRGPQDSQSGDLCDGRPRRRRW